MKKNLTLILLCLSFFSIQAGHKKFSVEEKVHKLFEHFVNLEDKGMSWKCFSQDMSTILRQKTQYTELADKFEKISSLTSAIHIGRELKPYEEQIPEPAKSLYNSLTYLGLFAIINKRVALNNDIICKHHHTKDEL